MTEYPKIPKQELEGSENASAGLNASDKNPRGEVSAATLGRMMGLATALEIKTLESKVDQLIAKLTAMGLKVDKMAGQVSSLPSAAELERIELQISGLKGVLQEMQNIMLKP